jgi:hypothetical protein
MSKESVLWNLWTIIFTHKQTRYSWIQPRLHPRSAVPNHQKLEGNEVQYGVLMIKGTNHIVCLSTIPTFILWRVHAKHFIEVVGLRKLSTRLTVFKSDFAWVNITRNDCGLMALNFVFTWWPTSDCDLDAGHFFSLGNQYSLAKLPATHFNFIK